MGGTIGVFLGSASSFNVTRLASNIGRSLSEEFTTHLIATDKTVAESATDAYHEVFGESNGGSRRDEIVTLRSYLRTRDPDALFQISNPPIHGSIVGTLASINDVPFVYRYSGDRFYEYKLSRGINKPLHFALNNVLGRYPLSLADTFVTLGPKGRKRLEARGVDREKISIIPPIVDQTQFSPSGSTATIDTDRSVGLFVGRISRKKGKETLERTLSEILDRRRDLQFVFLGTQQEPLDIPARYEDHITIVGPVPPKDVPQYYRLASFLIHPSLTEGMPRVVLEALASGTPVIARDVGEIADATENTFRTEAQFVEMVCSFEHLDVSPIDQFLFDTVSAKYRSTFSKLINKSN